MLSVTKTALKQLYDSLSAASDADDNAKCFRLMPKDASNLTLSYLEPDAGDRTFEFNGRTVLALPKELESYCSDKKLDVGEHGKLEIA